MHRIELLAKDGGPARVLALGAHCDDIEIGCGGTMLRLAATHPGLEMLWVVFCSSSTRALEARASAGALLASVAASPNLVPDFRGLFLPHSGAAVEEAVRVPHK